MTTTQSELMRTVASALGVELELVKAHAAALRETGLFPGADTYEPHPEHASVLLIALMTGASPSKSTEVMHGHLIMFLSPE